MERMPSIFNDVLSPVTPGPSSSNTCGPYCIARLARALLGEPPRRITVRMARRGGYYDTFYSMHSHEAILAALLGQELLRCDLSTMCRQADEAGLCYDFQFVDDLPVRPSELAEMDLSGDRRTIRLTGVSLGGGEIEITRLNGSDILLRGKRRETICLGPEGARVVPEDAAAGPGQWVARLEPLFPFPQQEGAVPGQGGELPVLHEAHLLQPRLEGRDGGEAVELPQGGGLVEAGGLVVEHHVVAVGDAHEVVAPGGGEEDGQVLDVVLVGLHVVGVAGVAAHGDAGELAHEVVLQARPDDLLGVVKILRPDEAHHRIDQEGGEPLAKP